jgi:uncharacterized protein YnzC (UPF0291/DUF896 family)
LNDYSFVYDSLGFKIGKSLAYDCRININNNEEFRKKGYDLKDVFRPNLQVNKGYYKVGEYLRSQIIFIGTVLERKSPLVIQLKPPHYRAKYKVVVDSVLRNTTNIVKIPKEYTIYKHDGLQKRDNKDNPILAQYYLTSILRLPIEFYDIGEKRLFFVNYYSIKSDHYRLDKITQQENYNSMSVLFDEIVNSVKFKNVNILDYYGEDVKLENLIELYKEIDEINDTLNFFKKGYK